VTVIIKGNLHYRLSMCERIACSSEMYDFGPTKRI